MRRQLPVVALADYEKCGSGMACEGMTNGSGALVAMDGCCASFVKTFSSSNCHGRLGRFGGWVSCAFHFHDYLSLLPSVRWSRLPSPSSLGCEDEPRRRKSHRDEFRHATTNQN